MVSSVISVRVRLIQVLIYASLIQVSNVKGRLTCTFFEYQPLGIGSLSENTDNDFMKNAEKVQA